MLRSVQIRNFRGFRSMEIDDCRRINIIVGENGSGKTALLEALFLAAGASPELAMRTRAWRGVESERLSGPFEDIYRALFADLFHRFQMNRSAVVTLKGTGQENRSVTITFHPQGQRRAVPPRRGSRRSDPALLPEPHPIVFEWKIEGRIAHRAPAEIRDDRLVFPPAPEAIIRAVFSPQIELYPVLSLLIGSLY